MSEVTSFDEWDSWQLRWTADNKRLSELHVTNPDESAKEQSVNLHRIADTIDSVSKELEEQIKNNGRLREAMHELRVELKHTRKAKTAAYELMERRLRELNKEHSKRIDALEKELDELKLSIADKDKDSKFDKNW